MSGIPEIRESHTLMVGRVRIPGISPAQETHEDMLISEMTEKLIPKSESASLNVSNAPSQNAQLSPV